jgi:hypothetical protein
MRESHSGVGSTVTAGSWGAALASASATVADSTQYTLKVFRDQRHVYAEKVGESGAKFSYDSSNDFGRGAFGLVSDKTNVTFDDAYFSRTGGYVSSIPRWRGTADVSLSTANQELTVNGDTHGGEVVLDGFGDDDCIAQWDANFNTSGKCTGFVRFADRDNHYRVELDNTAIRWRLCRGGLAGPGVCALIGRTAPCPQSFAASARRWAPACPMRAEGRVRKILDSRLRGNDVWIPACAGMT